MPVNCVPEGYHTITPYITVRDAEAAVAWYKDAFQAEELSRLNGPTGKLMHAELKIGDSYLMLADEFPDMDGTGRSPLTLGGTSCSIQMYVDNCDELWKRLVDAGATGIMPPADMFWGDRFGKVIDPFGHHWSIATHIEDVTEEEMTERTQRFFAEAGQPA